MSLKKVLRVSLATIIAPVLVLGVRLSSRTWKKDNADLEKIKQLVANGDRAIIVFWHGKFLPLFTLMEGINVIALTSDSFRGEVLVRMCRHFGYKLILTPPKGKGNRYDFVENAFADADLGVIVVDGPLGPQHVVKSGAIKMASSLGHFILPLSTASHPKKIIEKRWDKREVPAKGARVSLAVGDPIRIPPNLDRDGIKEWSIRIKDVLEDLDEDVEKRLLGSDHSPRGNL